MRWTIILVVVFVLINNLSAQSKQSFVSVEGQTFILDGRPYYFLGTNMWYGANLGARAEGGDRQRLIRELDHLKALGITNLRILGASEGLTQHNTVWPPIQPQIGQYDERILQGLDFLLAEMAKRNMKAVIFLNNFWVWSGGMSQYVSWLSGETLPNPFKEPFTWFQFMNFSARFYNDNQANAYFRKYVKHLILRTNTVNHRRYVEDPTIMSWQLANEPRPGAGKPARANFPVFLKWIKETSDFIRSMDANHLISTGNEGMYGSEFCDTLYIRMHQFKNIDYTTFHLWLLNWRWFDPQKPAATFPEALKKAKAYINQHVAFARQVGKPLVLEEFGLPRDGHSYSPQATTDYRNRYFRKVFDWIYRNASQGGPLAGSNFWAWSGEGRPRDPQNPEWKRGDDFTGDPPQEPQGRNSVFSSDSLTLKILKQAARQMRELSVSQRAEK